MSVPARTDTNHARAHVSQVASRITMCATRAKRAEKLRFSTRARSTVYCTLLLAILMLLSSGAPDYEAYMHRLGGRHGERRASLTCVAFVQAN